MREPMFRAPAVILWMIGVLVATHLAVTFLWEAQLGDILMRFAFFPARYGGNADIAWPGGLGADIWTFFTYAVLHGDAVHLGVNALWMLAFGSAVAWRLGTERTLYLSLICAVAGALAHLVTNWGDAMPMIGASAVVSGLMAAAVRFVFEMGGPLSGFRTDDVSGFWVPAVPLRRLFTSPRVLAFLGVWFALNILLGTGVLTPEGSSVAWQAHIGGFLAGLLLFDFFDPVKPPAPPKSPRRTHLHVVPKDGD
jgi:membrane associated rhomboid family serine protease